MMQMFENSGYKVVSASDLADIYIINTCTVTNMADKKSRQMLRRVKEINPDSILVAVRLLCTSSKRKIARNSRN